ncbi:MAG: hypothetical protein DWQ47_17230 [Acidobacteria bacterium]|nr:MAG: hypothetical protein DWQ32_04630 [Acidobacteriota bacterium]REK02216.1 MAG: hypothetical protein DWQ38_07520 [Acidobacteriota bacterium]REK13981.1 MAG: hypothetical protein DWQ43_10320 [Acidobacteriota bacterium]REK41976.1 MAG: hypothetical protein DWQ47_17230 [Acidobacteriota bacterium]
MTSDYDDFEQHLNDIEDELEDFESEFDDLEAELESEFPSATPFELTDPKVRTAVLSKDQMIALLCLKTADQGGAICRVDPREEAPAVQIYDDPVKAEEWFSKSLNTSRKNGWNVVYDGLPLKG